MPLYEFRCPKGHEFEKFYRSIGGAESEAPCPECGALASRLMSVAGLVFKGSGFYITDYGKDGKKAERDAATAASAKTAAASEGSGEKKSAEPAAAAPAPAPAPPAAKEATPAPASKKPAPVASKKAE